MSDDLVRGDGQVDLPVSECLEEIIATLERSVPVVLKAPPGAGKTTGVPPALLEHGFARDGQIILVQPRRLAARAAASRLAALCGTRLGEEIGYHVRFDRCANSKTQLLVVTTGILLRRLTSDPLLEGVSCVLLDEFHERSLEVDLALGMLHRVRATFRPELKLVVMSATLEPEPIVRFLGDAVAIESEGRSYPVEIEYADTIVRDDYDLQISNQLSGLMQRSDGHVLVFLPGVGEIRRVHRALDRQGFSERAKVMELYGDLSPRDQDLVLRDSSERKIILSTNVAETSVTIPGVGAVIDTGTARVLQFDASVGLPKLQLEPISQASAEQRAGRAGRTAHGRCLRLWPRGVQRSRRESDLPEVSRSDLSAAVLTLASWGERDIQAFPWITAPKEDAISKATTLLQRLDAIDADGNLTRLGELMSRLPLTPRLARFMIEARLRGIEEDASIAAALLSERDPFRGEQKRMLDSSTSCDIWDRVQAIKSVSQQERDSARRSAGFRQIGRTATQILRETKRLETDELACRGGQDREDASDRLKRSLLAAFPDRLAKRRQESRDRGVMVGRRGVRLDRTSSVKDGDLFLCIDVDAKGVEAIVRAASSIDEDWLDPKHIREVVEHEFDPSLASVVSRRRRYFEDLLLSESPVRCEPGPGTTELLVQHASADLKRVMPDGREGIQSLICRVRFLSKVMPELGLPPLEDDAMVDVLRQLCQTRTSFADLNSAPWLDHLRGRYDYDQLRQLDQHAPAKLTVPSGNAITVHYEEGKPPFMEVRIQELFGWRSTPRLAGGRVPVQLHLLGPNYRPQQITEDLENFWTVTYANVRKELRRRYPKHHWPEDPNSATATRNGLKPKS